MMAQSHTPTDDSTNRGIVDRVKDTATAQLSTQKERATNGLGSMAQAVRESTQRLRNEQHDTIAGLVEKAADQIERWSRQLENKDVDQLLTDMQRVARRQPALFVGSAFAAGLVGARFLKSSRQNGNGDRHHDRRSLYGAGTTAATAMDRPAGVDASGGMSTNSAAIRDTGSIGGTQGARTRGDRTSRTGSTGTTGSTRSRGSREE